MAIPLAVLSLFGVLKNLFWVSVFSHMKMNIVLSSFKHVFCCWYQPRSWLQHSHNTDTTSGWSLGPVVTTVTGCYIGCSCLPGSPLPQNPGFGIVFNGNRNHRHQHNPRLQPRARKSQCLQVAEISTPSVWPWWHRDSLVPTWSPVSIGTLEQKGCPPPS